MLIKNTLYTFLTLGLLILTPYGVEAQKPKNSYTIGSMWFCKEGYKKQGNNCVELVLPPNAYVLGNNWYCKDGFKRVGNTCKGFQVPANATALGSLWICNSGFKRVGNACRLLTEREIQAQKRAKRLYIEANSDGTVAFETNVDEADDELVKLRNGAVLSVTGYLGYVSYNADAVLFGSGYNCKIWISGKGHNNCELIKTPSYGRSTFAKRVYVSDIKASGAVVRLSDGTLLEVDEYDRNEIAYECCGEGLLIGGRELLLFNADKVVNVNGL